MMWIFGQVWFACLVGFAAGVLLDWVVRVRPLANRVNELEARLDAEGRSARADAVANGGSMFERGTYPPGRFDSTGFGGDRSRGLLTPADSASLATDLLEHDERGHDEPRSTSGVDDYPGVARLSGIWADEAAEEAPAEPVWQPSEAAEAAWQDSEAITPTSVTPLVPPASDADQAYLDFLTAGAGHADTDEGSAEVTSIMPYPVPGEDAVEGYQAFEGYREFSNNGYGTNGHQGDQGDYQDDEYQHDGYQIVDYQQDDLNEPAEPGTPLPQREMSDLGHRYAPFEIPFGQLDNSDVQPHAGGVTPIGEGGFLPFSKSADEINETTDPSSWFDMTDPGPVHADNGPATGSHRMLPIGRPGEDHPDLLPASVFGSEDDQVYQEDGQPRSLFEPVIAPETVRDDYATGAMDARAFDTSLFDPTGGQGTTPRPIRVRTGMDPTPANGSLHTATPETDAHPGPFGPGSALPLPDGTAPSPDFRVKARTSSMVFHTESSPFYERLEPQVWFRDPADAQRAGFTSWERPRSW